MTEDLQKYKKLYKLYSTLGTLVLADSLLGGVGIPFFAATILYPTLSSFLDYETTLTILGVYHISWMFLFIPAIVYNRKIRNIEKEAGAEIEKKKASKGFRTTIMLILIPFGLILLLGIVLNLLD